MREKEKKHHYVTKAKAAFCAQTSAVKHSTKLLYLQQRQVRVQLSEAVKDNGTCVPGHLQLHAVPDAANPPGAGIEHDIGGARLDAAARPGLRSG